MLFAKVAMLAAASRALTRSARYPAVRGGARSVTTMGASEANTFDYLVIGAGSGGMASARRAANYGAKVGVVERGALGGTCVNVGCVPKKVMFNAAHVVEVLHDAPFYNFANADKVTLDWGALKTARDNYVTRLNGIYSRNLDGSGVVKIVGSAKLAGNGEVTVDGETYAAKHILIATGGKPTMPADLDGVEHCISSNGFFELEEMPSRCLVVGAGYIAVELAGILNALGCETELAVRGDTALRTFDELLATTLDTEMKRQGMTVTSKTTLAKVENGAGGKTVTATDGRVLGTYDEVILAVGRAPLTGPLDLDAAGVKTGARGYVEVDEYQNTSADGVYAVGDVCGNVELTPMAIAAGRRLADRLFDGQAEAKADYSGVPTVVFSHPPIGTLGLSEADAVEKYGGANVKVFKSVFVNLWYGPMPIEPSDKPRTAMKVVCAGTTDLVVGLHVIGIGADEMLQGFGVAMKMGMTKADLDSCIAIHPTASEELVTLAPWGEGAGDKKGGNTRHEPVL